MSEASTLDGQQLGGRYVIERELGRGGTSTVYLAHDRVYDRRVAVKVLRRELAMSVGADRFLREVRVTARLNHPHIAPVIDSGLDDGRCYFVSTYLEGGTLRQRLEQERQLPIAEAIRIAEVVAGTLDYAHSQGVLHCDVKPENILFSNGEPFLTDFGIARLFEAEHWGSTSTGIVRGTPAYMSPEQAGGEKGYDGRTDIYSLACVLYEMLAGVPAFVGPTPQAVLAQRFLHAPRELRVYRPTVPRHIENAIGRAMSVSPDDRFATAGEFAQALHPIVDPVAELAASASAAPPNTAKSQLGSISATRLDRLTRKSILAGVAVATFVGTIAWLANTRGTFRLGGGATSPFESVPIVVFPFARESSRAMAGGEDIHLHDALARWRGLRLVDVARARGIYAQRDSTRLNLTAARKLAEVAGARRLIWGRVIDRGDTVVLVASIYDVKQGDEPLRTETIPLPAVTERDSVFDHLASALAFGPTRSIGSTGLAGTRSPKARSAYVRGLRSLSEWDLARADSAFAEALESDREYGQALLWRAQVAGWRSDTSAQWRELTATAIQYERFLGARDRALARAGYFHSSRQYLKACPIYRQLAATDAQDFAAWFGLAECLRHDEVVIPDTASASGLRFRSSYAEALRAYQRAFVLMPTVSRAYRPRAFRPLQALLFTLTAQLRRGYSEDGTQPFAAYPAWTADSLAFVPYPLAVVNSLRSSAVPPSVMQAMEQNRHLFRQIAESWAAALPRDATILEALAIARDLDADPSGIEVLERALLLAPPSDRVTLAATLAWLRVKHGCGRVDGSPPHTSALAAARRLADSVLAAVPHTPTERDLGALLGLAAITGQPSLGAGLARRHARPSVSLLGGRRVTISARIIGQSTAFLIYAAVGAPVDSIIESARRADAAIRSDLSEDVQEEARRLLFTQPIGLAFPAAGRVLTLDAEGRADYLLATEEAFAAGQPRRVKELLREVRGARRHLRPADLRFDSLYPEAWMLAAIGDSTGALAWISPSLDALSSMPPQLIDDPANIGALMQGMGLRARLEARKGVPNANNWAACRGALRAETARSTE